MGGRRLSILIVSVLPQPRVLFSDPLHPSAAVHRLIGQAATVAVGVPQVPEPSTFALVACALLVVAGRVSRARVDR